jgi:endonuclease-3
MNDKQRAEIFRRFQADNPHPTTELHFQSPFYFLMGVIFPALAPDVGVNKATALLFPIANTPEQILQLGEEGLKKYIKTIGLFNSKASNIIKTCQRLIEHHHSEVPPTREALESLPGVGRKTANVVLNTAFDYDTIAVDTHILRVSNRTGLAKGQTPQKVEEILLKVVPKQYRKDAHHWLILHGRYICTARKPKCPVCPIQDICEYPEKTKI